GTITTTRSFESAALAGPAAATASKLTTTATIQDRDPGRHITEPPSYGDPDGSAWQTARTSRDQCAEARSPGPASARPGRRATAISPRRYGIGAAPSETRPEASRALLHPSAPRARAGGSRPRPGHAAPERT